MKPILFSSAFVCFLVTKAFAKLPFDGLPDHVNVIVSKDGHSVPHSLSQSSVSSLEKHEDNPPTEHGGVTYTIKLEQRPSRLYRYKTGELKEKELPWYQGIYYLSINILI